MDFLPNEKLVIVGAAGMIGSNMAQTACMMRLTNNICLYDVFSAEGVAKEMRQCGFDDITITKGPQFEVYAQDWLDKNPGKTGLDVPPLKFNLKGRHLIMPGRQFCEYQMRATVEDVDDCKLDRMDIRILYVSFPFDDRPSLQLPLYAPKSVLKDFDPKAGDEIDAYVWLQGRVIDMDESPAQ